MTTMKLLMRMRCEDCGCVHDYEDLLATCWCKENTEKAWYRYACRCSKRPEGATY